MERQDFIEGLENLTPQQRKVLSHVLAGETDLDIAKALNIQPSTVRKHIERIYKVLNLVGEFSDDRRSRRNDLLKLVSQYKPDIAAESNPETIEKTITNLDSLINPFLPLNGVVEESHLFFGRSQEVERIFEILNSGSSVAIIGERQIGKSSLLMEISRQAKTQLLQPRQPIYMNLQHIHDEAEFYEAFCEAVGIKEIYKGYRLSRELQNYRLLLILDEVEKMTGDSFTNNIRGQLRGLAEGMNAPLRLLVAGSTCLDQLFPDSKGMTSPFTGICMEEKLERWDEATIREFIDSRLNSPLLTPDSKNITFSEDEIKQLINDSGGHPQILMELCYQMFNRYLKESK